MGDMEERPPDDWGTVAARWTFISTLILAVLYAAAVYIMVMR